jgi:hypothetical protein
MEKKVLDIHKKMPLKEEENEMLMTLSAMKKDQDHLGDKNKDLIPNKSLFRLRWRMRLVVLSSN